MRATEQQTGPFIIWINNHNRSGEQEVEIIRSPAKTCSPEVGGKSYEDPEACHINKFFKVSMDWGILRYFLESEREITGP